MALPNKPTIKNVWATSGVKVEPSDTKVNAGWIVERPPHQFQNFLQNRSDQFLKHINEAGIPVWDAATVYTANRSYVQGSDGKLYKALTNGANQNPVGNPTNWMLTLGDADFQEIVDQAQDSATQASAAAADSIDARDTAESAAVAASSSSVTAVAAKDQSVSSAAQALISENNAADSAAAALISKNAAAVSEANAAATLEGAATKIDLAAPSTLPAYGFSASEMQGILDKAFPLATYAAMLSYSGRATGINITTPDKAGLFNYNVSSPNTTDGGTFFAHASGVGRWERIPGFVATPAMFELPLTSSGVDNTTKLQAILNCPRFAFPSGFQSHTSTLQLKSNCEGDFGNAVFTLLPSSPSGTQIIILGKNFTAAQIATYTPERCTNSIFYGGVFDGNKANNTSTTNAGGAAGGDGGMHGLQIHDAVNVHWYGPKFQNCGTDGIIVWQRRAGTVAGVVRDVHIHGPISDGNGRQGVSVISADDVHFYDSTFSNTGIGATGKSPRSGIDLEGNASTDFISAYFHGVTQCFGNVGRGMQTTTPSTYCGARFDRLLVHDNLASDAQFSIYGGAGDAINEVSADSIEVYNGTGVLLSQGVGVTAGAINKFRCGSLTSKANVAFNGVAQLDIDLLDATSTSTAFATLNLYTGVGGLIRRAIVANTGTTNSHFPVYMQGATPLRIGTLTTTGVRGATLSPASNKTIDSLTINGALTGSGLAMAGACEDNLINIQFGGTISADYPVTLSGASARNDISFAWPLCTRSMINIASAADGNRIRIQQAGSYTGSLILVNAAATNNLIHSSVFKSTTPIIAGSGTGWKIMGSTPFSVNSTS